MAIQGFTTGSQGVLMMAPVLIDSLGVATLPTAASVLPNRVQDLYNNQGNINTSTLLELAIYSSRADQVGIISSAPAFDANPKTMTFTIDRDDP